MVVLKDRVIFILSLMKFDGAFESTNYTIARKLAEHNDVYFIDNPYTHKDFISRNPIEAFERRKRKFSILSDGILDTDLPRLKVVVCPPLLSINFLPEGLLYRALLRINEGFINRRIRQVLRNQKIDKFIYINSFNFWYPNVAASLPLELKVYHCVDPLITAFDRRHGLISEEQLVKQSDLVICTSKQLYLEKSTQNQHVYYVPNAADVSHSSKALDPALAIHPAIAALKNKPLVGYFGNIERRMDFEMLDQITALLKDINFVFAGPYEKDALPKWMLQRDNVFLTGRFPYTELPSVLKGFDVAWIPFKKDEVSRTIFPLKLFEYLGAGKATLCTNFNPDLHEFTQGMVYYSSNAAELRDNIAKALDEAYDPELIKSRVEVASKNTWDERMKSINTILLDGLARKA